MRSVPGESALARVEPGFSLGAQDRSRRAIKSAKKAIADRRDLAATEEIELLSDEHVVSVQQLAPRAAAALRSVAGRRDDVSE
jgi:hypothetical protein